MNGLKEFCQFHYETEANASFLVSELEATANLVQYQMKMLENNHIVHLLDVKRYRQNEKIRLRYNVTGRMSLAQILEREKLKRKDFLTLVSALLESYEDLSSYQLSFQGIMLDERSIFIRNGTFEPDFIYLPLFQGDESLEGLRTFVRNMVMNSRLASTGDDFIQQLLDVFNRRDLTLEDLRDEVNRLRQPVQPTPPPPPMPEPPKVPDFVPPAPEQKLPPAQVRRNVDKPDKKSGKQRQTKKKETDKRSTIFIAIQAVIVVALALIVKSGFFLTEEGTVNVSYIAGVLLAVAGLDFVVYREMFVNKKEKTKSTSKTTAKPKKNDHEKPHIRPESRHAVPPAPEPAPQAAVPQPHPAAPVVPVAPVMPVGLAEEEEHTVVMGAGSYGEGYLEYFENGLAVRIHLNRDVTRVGSKAQSVDHVLLSHKVSKVHAEFIRRNGHYYVRDINSTNGTFLNGGRDRIVSNQDIEIHNGDHIRLADIELKLVC